MNPQNNMDDTNPTPNVEVNNQPMPVVDMPSEPVASTPVPDPTMPQPEPMQNQTSEPVASTPSSTPNQTVMPEPKKSFMQKLLHPFSKN